MCPVMGAPVPGPDFAPAPAPLMGSLAVPAPAPGTLPHLNSQDALVHCLSFAQHVVFI